MNQAGRMPSHPATIGSRVLPVNITLACATRTAASTTIVMAAIGIVNPSAPKPMLSTCGIGAMRSMRSSGTSASTELVPKMNMIAMIGVAITTDRAIVRTGLRHSPAWMATYSKPPSAPNPILPSRLRLMSEATGAAVASGWNAGSAPFATFSQGTTSNSPKVTIRSAPPLLCTHLPRLSPRIASHTRPPKVAALTSMMTHGLPVHRSAPRADDVRRRTA